MAEGPTWSVERNSLFWVDIEGKTLNEFKWQSGHLQQFSLPDRVGFLAEVGHDQLILGLQDGLYRFNLSSHKLILIQNIERGQENMRCNDGKCDTSGRLWFGTMDINTITGAGALYVFDQQQGLQKKLGKLDISNGMAWSLNNERFYHIDSTSRNVKSYFFDPIRGDIKFEKIIVEIPENQGLPDGMTIDHEGKLWIAQWGGFGIGRWDPENGQLLSRIDLPVPNVTSCAFGGEDLEYLFITTASQSLSKQQLEKYPLSGSVFVMKTGSKGLLPNKFKSS